MEQEKKCLVCKKIFTRPYRLGFSLWEKRKYCGTKCAHSIPKSIEYKKHMRDIMLGNKNWMLRNTISQEEKDATKRRMIGNKYGAGTTHVRARMFGEKNPRWISDRTLLVKKQERNDMAYKEWRRNVWVRDNYKCKINNQDCDGRIEAHHILGWTEYVELRYEINNGITLCHAHHPRKRAEEKRLVADFQQLVSVSK